MDKVNRKIIDILQQNCRISFADLGKNVHLSAPAVAERVKRLESSGLIIGYRALVNVEHLGYPIEVIIQAKVFFGKETTFIQFVKSRSEVIECVNVTGDKAFVLKVIVQTMTKLDALLEEFSFISETSTMVVLSYTVQKTVIQAPTP
jgi:Lrp/AsnC family leucine-responsive transcriptional regulator